MKRCGDECRGIRMYRFQPCWENQNSDLRASKISPELLWFSTPKKLNDPMDIDHSLDDLMRDETGESLVLRQMAKVMYESELSESLRPLISEDLLSQIRSWACNGGDSWDLCDQFRGRLLQLGVACFTPNWNTPPMWAHYADNWEGFAIEYCVREMDIVGAQKNSMFRAFWVNYASRIEQTSLSELLCSPYEAMRRILSAKTLPWAYEEEWRLIQLASGDAAVELPAGMRMTGIVLGPKSPLQQTHLFEQKCSEWQLPLRKVTVGLDKRLHLHPDPALNNRAA